jgi:ribosome-binding factor A
MPRPQKKSFKRSLRVQDRIQQDVADLLLKKVKDPRIGFVTVTAVEMSDDLKNGKVYVSVMGSEEEVSKSMKGLKASEGFIQREIWKGLEIKARPEIHFHLDASARQGAKIDALLKKLKDEGEL